MTGPTIEFWQQRFDTGTTPWDRGEAGPQLVAWLARDEIARGQRVLVPGCGAGWDVAALARHGAHVTGIDYTPAAVRKATALLDGGALDAAIVQADVLDWRPPQPVDAVYEQTCLCALHPDHWMRYAAQLHRWIRPGGKLLAMFMQKPRPEAAQGAVVGPPYHGDINAMRALFPSGRWTWPKPPYPASANGDAYAELGVVLTRI